MENIKIRDVKSKTEKDKITVASMIKVMLMIFFFGNLLYAAISFLLGDVSHIEEVLLRTGVCTVLNLLLFLGAELCIFIENRRWKAKNRIDTNLENNYKTLKCNGGNYMLYLSVFLLDLMVICFFWYWNYSEKDSLIISYQNGELVEPFICIIAMNLFSIFSFLYFNCKKVFYTEHFIYVVCYMQRDTISWSSLQKIEYHCKKKPKLVFTTREKTIVINSAVLCDGWSDFLTQVINEAKKYNIYFIKKGKS